MTECRLGCGACCDPVVLSLSQIEFAKTLGMPPGIRNWILNDLTPMSRREAKAKAPWNFGEHVAAMRVIDSMPWYYSCRHYDAETTLCGIHDHRPKPCQDYPWGDDEPDPSTMLPPTCSFRADIGKTVEPLRWEPVTLSEKP